MRTLLAIPFRDEGIRGVILEKVLEELLTLYDFDSYQLFDSGHDIFNRSASRNEAVDYALKYGYDVIVLCDADSIPEKNPLTLAIEGAHIDGRLHVPFDIVRVTHTKYLKPKVSRYDKAIPLYSYGPSCGGVFVIRPRSWVDIGGMDERIIGWGFEDQIFLVAVQTVHGGYTTHRGSLYNFQHKRGGLPAHEARNIKLRDIYNHFNGDLAKIREIQRGSNHFCPHKGSS